MVVEDQEESMLQFVCFGKQLLARSEEHPPFTVEPHLDFPNLLAAATPI
jgi:hypothetical protein